MFRAPRTRRRSATRTGPGSALRATPWSRRSRGRVSCSTWPGATSWSSRGRRNICRRCATADRDHSAGGHRTPSFLGTPAGPGQRERLPRLWRHRRSAHSEDQPVSRDLVSGAMDADWEREAAAAGDGEIRVALLRLGLVLGHDGGAFPVLAPAVRQRRTRRARHRTAMDAVGARRRRRAPPCRHRRGRRLPGPGQPRRSPACSTRRVRPSARRRHWGWRVHEGPGRTGPGHARRRRRTAPREPAHVSRSRAQPWLPLPFHTTSPRRSKT